VKEELLHDPVKISELPDVIEYALPQRLKGIRDYVKHKSITKEHFSKFFRSLERMWNILDCDLLCFMVKKYGKLELQEKCEKYKKNIEVFCAETTISDLIKYWNPRFVNEKIPVELKSCVMELSWDPKTKQELAMAAFCLFYMCPGSVIVMWLVREELLSQVMTSLENLLQKQPEFIADNKITFILFTSSSDKVCLYIHNFNVLTIRSLLLKYLILRLLV